LDDILKGLDADTYSKCFTAVLGPEGLLRARSRTTIVMATHNGELTTLMPQLTSFANSFAVQLLPHADHVVVLDDEGRIIEQGNFKDLKGAVSRLGLKELSQEVMLEKTSEELSSKKALLAKVASVKSQKTTVEAPAEGDQSRGRRNADALVSYMRAMGSGKLLAFCLLTLGSTGFRFAGRK
jgi:hypothetical protein